MLTIYNFTKHSRIIVLSLIIFLIGVSFQSVQANAVANRVLILSSYHAGLTWSDSELDGVRSALPENAEIFIEYMDAKRVSSPAYLAHLESIYSIKYQYQPPDVLITLDDDAFRFAMFRHNTLFEGIPIVFAGVNHLDPRVLEGDPLVTGVVETLDIETSIMLALQQNPAAEQVYLVTDNTTTGLVNRAILEELGESGKFPQEFRFLVPQDGLPLEALLDALRAIPEGSVVYFADFFQDVSGNVINPEEIMPLVAEATRGPIYVHSRMYIGHGAVGGKVNDGKAHGQAAGALAARVLAGEPVSSIPIVTTGENQFIFDYRQMVRWGISEATLPAGSQVLSRPPNWLDVLAQNRNLIIGILGFVVFQGMVIWILGWNLHSLNNTEKALRQSDERWQFALLGSGDGVWDWDMRSERVSFSPRYVEMLGYTNAEFGDTVESWATRVHPDDLDRARTDLLKHVNGETPSSYLEFRMRAKDGSYRWILGRGKVIAFAEDGSALRMVGTHTDITKQKSDEEKIRQLNATLEQRVAERTRQLEVANQELEAFSYSVSHDLRAPLRGIDGLIQLMIEDYGGTLPDDALESLASIRDSSQRMAELIDALLGLSRVSRAELHRVQVNMSEMAQDISKSLHARAPARVVEWIFPKELRAQADPHLTRILLTNLLENAWKFTALCSSARIELGVTRDNGKQIYFVCDNGAGFDMAYAPQMFRAFQRLHSASEFEGTGIGLTTVERIVHRHGGGVWAEGAPGQGATFFFTLPD